MPTNRQQLPPRMGPLRAPRFHSTSLCAQEGEEARDTQQGSEAWKLQPPMVRSPYTAFTLTCPLAWPEELSRGQTGGRTWH